MKYVIFDGYALAYRALYGFPKLFNNQGRETQVTCGFFKMVHSTIMKYQIPANARIIFVFDSKERVFRKEKDPEYKANRKAKEQSFYDQVEEIVDLCSRIWTVYRMPGYEADDLAGSFVNTKVKDEDECLLVTVDKDWLQLLRRNVTALMLSTQDKPRFITDQQFFADNGGIAPINLIDLKALLGDGSDNIPGIKGVGWVTAQKLIKQYKTVEAIYDNILLIPNKGKLQQKLVENKERVMLNKELVTIICDLQLEDPKIKVDTDAFCGVLDYLEDTLNAQDLANQMGLLLQFIKESEV